VSRRVAALVLAAGASSRMGGANKLLAPLEGEALVARSVDAVLGSAARPVLVVTGHAGAAVRAALAGRDVRCVANPRWAEGMGTSLAAGVAALPEGVAAVLVCLGDMPWVRPRHLDALIAAFEAGPADAICAPSHRGRRGHPVLFAARYFREMRELAGDAGARALIEAHPDALELVAVDDPGVLRDVDRPGDLERACRT
jgi:molybdenum cofactor cytidylyltransferase